MSIAVTARTSPLSARVESGDGVAEAGLAAIAFGLFLHGIVLLAAIASGTWFSRRAS